jgi:plastocyanin
MVARSESFFRREDDLTAKTPRRQENRRLNCFRRIPWRIGVVAVQFSLLLSGCGKSDQTAAPPRPAPPPGAGTIQGQVIFAGQAPLRQIVSGDYKTADGVLANVLDETVVVNPNGSLRNVLVYVKDAPPGDGGGPPVIIDQKMFHYVPHVLALQVGQPLVIQNSDHHMHNIHLKCQINPEQNFAMMDVGQLAPIVFKAPEFFQIKCDVHPWMDAEVGVFDHPYFAVTGDDGGFVIKNVPPGSYTLVARHERYGELTQSVTVADKQTVQAVFRYGPP